MFWNGLDKLSDVLQVLNFLLLLQDSTNNELMKHLQHNSNSIRTLSMSGGAAFPYNFAEGFRDLSNGHIIRGIKDFARKIKAPALPNEEGK